MLRLNDTLYSRNDLFEQARIVLASDAENWEKDIWSFLQNWLDEADFVTVHTSGSTGIPKPIHILKKQMIASAQATGSFLELGAGQSALLCLPCQYIAGRMMLVRAMVLGLDLYAVKPSSNPFENLAEYIDIEFVAMIPLQVEKCLSDARNRLEKTTQIIIGGAAVSESLHQQLQPISPTCFATYGMTETVTHIALQQLNHAGAKSYFSALPNVHFSLDERQCLVIDAPRVSTVKIVTNDVVELRNETSFKWLGRQDNVINSGGVKIHPEQVEKKLQQVINLPYFVVGIPHARLGEQVVLCIENKDNQELDINFKTYLQAYEIPKQVFYIPAFHRTETGKIKRNKTIEFLLK